MRIAVTIVLLWAHAALAQIPTTPPLASDQTMTGINGVTFTYDDLVNDWLGSSGVVIKACSVGGAAKTCLFVPKFGKSSICDFDGTKCGIGTATSTHFCMVTDELSLIGLGLAMQKTAHGESTHPTAFAEWVNTIRLLLRREPSLPLWNVAVDTSGATATITDTITNTDDASDATARIILALFIAANDNDRTAAERSEYRALASEIARGLQKDFIAASRSVSIHGSIETIDHWLATGHDTARNATPESVTNDKFSFAGYFGDVTLALIASAKGATSDREVYEALAKDTVKNYLRAAGYNTTFAVPYTSFIWKNDLTTTCMSNCNANHDCGDVTAWDDADAPRAISLCKAEYAAAIGGISLPPALDAYCNAWLTRGFQQPPPDYQYARRYGIDGTPCAWGGAYQENGLGALMHFAYGRDQFSGRLAMAFNTYQRSAPPHKFKDDTCLGVYTQAWAFLTFGSGAGRDAKAYATPDACSIALTADVATTSVTLTWSPASNATSYRIERNDAQTFTTNATTYADAIGANSVHFYRVVALDGAQQPLGTSNRVLATSFAFTHTLTERASTIYAVDVNELRSAINAVCDLAGTPHATGANVVAHTPMHASDITTLRSAIEAARVALGVPLIGYLQPSLAPQSSAVRASDVRELRRAVE